MVESFITLNGTSYIRADRVSSEPSTVQIVVLQRGWIVVGRVSEDKELPDEYIIRDAQVIRRWGTTKGLGELVNGPLADTKLDLAGTVRAHKLGVVLRIDADETAWENTLSGVPQDIADIDDLEF